MQKIKKSDVDIFRKEIHGKIITKNDNQFDDARSLWNGMIDKKPAVIVKCKGAADVMKSVKFARAQQVPISVRGGGHNVSGKALCNDGVVIDLSPMRSVRVDPDRETVRAEGGATLGDIDQETQAFGLAVPMGVVSKTGVSGLALHGGFGFLTRKYGLTCDNIIAADVVIADGKLVTSDSGHNPDLLWALKGGGGNFGVVTSLEFQAYPIGPKVWLGLVFYPVDATNKVLHYLKKLNTESPDELYGLIMLWNAPHEDEIPEEYHGSPVCVLLVCYCGDPKKGEEAIRPARTIATPIADMSGPFSYLDLQKLFDPEYPDGRRYYWKSTYINGLNDEIIDVLKAHAANRPSPLSTLDVWAIGGAVNRIKPEETAFAHRNAPYLVAMESNWDDPAMDEANIEWARETFQALQRFSPGGTYLNFPGFAEEGEELMKKTYGQNYDRLRKIKAKYDPDNFFRSNFNINPKPG